MIPIEEIKNPIQQLETAMRRMGHKIVPEGQTPEISEAVASFVKLREMYRPDRYNSSPYHCTCNNWGPRFIENSKDGCCPGCFNWAMDHHYEYSTHGQAEWLTCDWLEGNTWGIHVDNLRKVIRKRQACTQYDRPEKTGG